MKKAGMLLLASLAAANNAAAGGLYLYEVSATESMQAGAGWAARAQDATTVFTNPAGMTGLEGDQLEAALLPLFLRVDFNANDNTTVSGTDDDADDILPAGGVYYTSTINDRWSWGVSAGGYFGLGVDFDDDWVGRYYVDEITLQAIAVQPAVAYRVTESLSLGVGAVLLYGFLDQTIAVNNPEPRLGDASLTIDDDDFSFQLNVGLMFEPSDRTRFGVQYLGEGDLDFDTDREFRDAGPIISSIAERLNLAERPINLEFTLPQSIIGSVFHQATDNWAIMANLGWQEWSEFGKVDIAVGSEDTTNITANRNYKDTWHIAVGGQRSLDNGWTLNGGVAYDTTMVEDEDRTLDLAVGSALRVGFGATWQRRDDLDLKFGYSIVWSGDLPVDVNRGPLSGRVAGAFEDTVIHVLAFGMTRRF